MFHTYFQSFFCILSNTSPPPLYLFIIYHTMAQVHAVRVKKWTQLRPEDFNGQASASLNARKRHSASPELTNTHDGPPSPEVPRSLSVSPPPFPSSSSYHYHQHVYYQSSQDRAGLSSSLPHPSHLASSPDDMMDWPHRDARHHPTLPPLPLPSEHRSLKTFRHNEDEDHFYNPYSRPPTRRALSRSNPNPKHRSISPVTIITPSPRATSPPPYHGPPNNDFVSPPPSPPSLTPAPIEMWKKMGTTRINAQGEEEHVPFSSHDSQGDGVVPSMQKMKICNLVE